MDQQKFTVEQFAKTCGVSANDATAFIECLRIWVAKGHSIEAAIAKHMATMSTLVAGTHEIGEGVRREFAAGLYDELRAEVV